MAELSAQEGMDTSRGPVLPKCTDTSASGHWHCVTHGEDFPHNWALESHAETGEHVVAWICHVHGPEVP